MRTRWRIHFTWAISSPEQATIFSPERCVGRDAPHPEGEVMRKEDDDDDDEEEEDDDDDDDSHAEGHDDALTDSPAGGEHAVGVGASRDAVLCREAPQTDLHGISRHDCAPCVVAMCADSGEGVATLCEL